MISKQSKNKVMNPYWKIENWSSGKLCYWRNNMNYSDKTKKELENRLKQMIQNDKS